MPDKTILTIELTPDEHEQLEVHAQQQGYDTPADLVRALIESNAQSITDSPPLAERFRSSLQDAIAGETYPISTLWDNIDDE